jgi:hypothetical protein
MIARNASVLTFDLECVPLAAHVDRVMAAPFDEDGWSAPANYKDPAKIEAKRDEARAEWEASKAERCAELALSPRTGRVVVVGTAINADQPFASVADTEDREREILGDLWQEIRAASQVVGFNSHIFDLPFIVTRSVLLGVEPTLTAGQIAPLFRRYTHRPHADVRMMLTNWDMRAPGKKADWAAAFGYTPQSVTGADVWQLYQSGNLGAIADHCCADVAETYGMFVRLAPYYLGD